jgi:RimJ/RimL family protein N-acetyltransferase
VSESTSAPGGRPAASASRHDFPGSELVRSRRLRLNGLRYADIPFLSRLYAHSEVQQLLLDDSPTRFIEVAALVAWVNQLYERRPGLGIWRADRIGGDFLGTFSLMPIEASGEVEIGVRLTPEAWGHWYAVEGGRLLCEHAFATLRLPRVVGYFHPDNRVVARILARIGFTDEGEADYIGKRAIRYVLRAEAFRRAARSEVVQDPAGRQRIGGG